MILAGNQFEMPETFSINVETLKYILCKHAQFSFSVVQNSSTATSDSDFTGTYSTQISSKLLQRNKYQSET